MIKKIILTGTHHSGKSTLIDKYKEHSKVNVMGELIRSLSLEPNFHFKPDKPEMYKFSELALVNFYVGIAKSLHMLNSKKLWLFDRHITDTMPYIDLFNMDGPHEVDFLYGFALHETTKLISLGYFNDTLFLLMKPIKIKEHDNFRLEGDEIQNTIYQKSKATLDVLNLRYKEVDSIEAESTIEDVIMNNF